MTEVEDQATIRQRIGDLLAAAHPEHAPEWDGMALPYNPGHLIASHTMSDEQTALSEFIESLSACLWHNNIPCWRLGTVMRTGGLNENHSYHCIVFDIDRVSEWYLAEVPKGELNSRTV